MVGMGAVAEVEAENVRPRGVQGTNPIGVGTGRAEGG